MANLPTPRYSQCTSRNRMKWIKRIAIVVVLLIIISLLVVYFSLNSIVRSVIERQATASLGVQTTLGSAQLAIFGGSVKLNQLDVSSPPKFSAPSLFTLDDVGVNVQYGQLTSTPIHITKIVIDHPTLVIEQADLKLNLQALMSQPSQTPQTSGGQPSQPIKLIIDELDLNSAQVTFRPGIPGLTDSVTVQIPSLTLKNIGNADGNGNGEAIKEVVVQTATALAAKGADAANLPPQAKALLAGGLGDLSKQFGDQFKQDLSNLAGNLLNGKGSSKGEIQQDLQNLLGGNKNKQGQ